MQPSSSLRRRIIAAYVLLAFVVCACFSAAAVLTINEVEGQLIDKRLGQVADHVIANPSERNEFDLAVGMHLFINDEIPQNWRQLSPGYYEDDYADEHYHLLVRKEGLQRFVLADDQSRFEHIENFIYAALAAASLGCLLLAFALGRLTASRIIAPVTALAEAVEHPRADIPLQDAQDEIGVLARAFAARTREQEGFLQREQLFTGDVSHELRTPLTVILGASELLLAQVHDNPAMQRVVERIHRATGDATEQVNALLLLSRAPETLDAPHTALQAVLQHEVERCQPLLKARPVELRLDIHVDAWVAARPELVGMAIGNLLRNACQYTESGAVIAHLYEDRIEIEDSGPGLPDSIKDQLFKRFVHERQVTPARTGLGLSIVKRIVEHLGWQISLADRPGGGTQVILTFASGKSAILTRP